MLFKKKKKDEEEVVANPFETVEDVNENKQASTLNTDLINEVEFNEPNYTEVVNPAILTEETVVEESIPVVTEVPVSEPISNITEEEVEDKEILNEVHPSVLEESESNSDVMDFKAMNVDELIQDVIKEVYCPNCGSKVSADSDLCNLCGAALK